MRTLRRSFAALGPSFALLGVIGCGGAGVGGNPPAIQPPTATPAASASIVAVAASAPAVAPAPPPPPLTGDGPQTDAVPIEGTDFVRGRTAIKVNAPIGKVRESILDFAHYAEFMPHYRSARVL